MRFRYSIGQQKSDAMAKEFESLTVVVKDVLIRRFVCKIPFPPSVNQIWRSVRYSAKLRPGDRYAPHNEFLPLRHRVRMYRSEKYNAWQAEADALLLSQRLTGWDTPQIPGQFIALVQLDEKLWSRHADYDAGDCDNRIKAPLDWAQHAGLIEDDRMCRRATAEWAPLGDAFARLWLWQDRGKEFDHLYSPAGNE